MRSIVAGWAALALLAPGLGGCGKNGDGAPAPAPPPSAVDSAAPSQSEQTSSAPADGALHVVATGPLVLRGLGREAAVVSGDLVIVADGKGLRQDPADYPIDAALAGFDRLRGVAPGAVWLEKQGRFFHRVDAGWREVKLLGPGEALLDIVPWGEGRAAGLVARESGELRWVAGDAGGGPVPAAPRRLEGASSGEDAGAPARLTLDPRGTCSPVAGSEAGQILLVGHDPTRLRTPLVERWAPGATESTLAELPKPRAHEDRDLCVTAAGAREAWVWGNGRTPYLAHFDGAAWTREDPPGDARPVTLVGRDDGAVFLVMLDTVYLRLPASPTWQAVALPDHPHGLASAALVAGKLWLTSADGLLGPEAPPAVLAIPGYRIGAPDAPRFPPMTAACAHPYVLLEERVPPAKKDYPELVARIQAAIPLDGVELGTEMSGKFTHIGARLPTVALAKTLGDKLGGAALCHVPKLLKKIPLEPASSPSAAER